MELIIFTIKALIVAALSGTILFVVVDKWTEEIFKGLKEYIESLKNLY